MGIRDAWAVLVALVLTLAGCAGSDGTTGPDERTGWQAAQAIGSTDFYLGSLAGNGSGQAVLVWIPPTAPDAGASIVARQFAPATGWGSVQTVAPSGPNLFQSPVAAMDSRGTVLAVWPALAGLFVSTALGSTFDTPRLVSTQSSLIQNLPAVGAAGPGVALVMWTEGSTRALAVSANRRDATLGWLSPETVWSIGAHAVSAPALAVPSTGFGLTAWVETRETDAHLWWSTFDPRRGWAVAQLVGLVGSPRLMYGVRVATNAAGEGVLAWTQDDLVYASRYTTVEGPGVPEVLGRGACQGLAVDGAGNALALLNQPLVPQAGLVLSVYRSGRGWDPMATVVAGDAGGGGALSMDPQGNAWTVWADAAGVHARRYVSSQGLQAAQQIATGGPALLPQVVAEADGGAMTAWLNRGDPDRTVATILAARFVTR